MSLFLLRAEEDAQGPATSVCPGVSRYVGTFWGSLLLAMMVGVAVVLAAAGLDALV